MRIAAYGIDVVLKYCFIGGIFIFLAFFFLDAGLVQTAVLVLIVLSVALILNFFRDPERETPEGKDLIISPADGRVFLITEIFESEYLNQNAVQISIFMSPLNVHVNRFPITGKIGYFRHIEGRYTPAFKEKSSELNERTLIGIEDNGYKVLFRQIAGTVARRIVADLKVGDPAVRGKRFGMIKFGSRVDVLIPGRFVIKVKLNDKVLAGETVLGSYSQ